MSEQQQTEGVDIYDPCECVTAKMLGDKTLVATLRSLERKKITGENGREKQGWRATFDEKRKNGKPIMVDFACMANMDALNEIFGTRDTSKYVGHKVKLYTAKTSRGPGIRFAKAE